MLFNSFEFLVFFIVIALTFFSLPHKFRWAFLLAASYYFYMSWQPAYALLIAFTTLVSFVLALGTDRVKSGQKRKFFFWTSIVVCLGVLFFFKYFNFFNYYLGKFFSVVSIPYDFSGFDILLPVGISFYTFQTLSYNIDVYFGVRSAEKHLGIYALYVSFFPQLVAGPIERSTALMPQFYEKKSFSLAGLSSGVKFMIWGMFKKVVIADRLSVLVNSAFNQPYEHQGSTFILAVFLFAFQLYCDFSAYSDIAKGAARVLGYELMENFNHPYISKNITEFWRRWHISLSTWLRDYLYTPIVFSKKRWGKRAVAYSIFITFILCGLWHGPKVTFVIFGFLQGFALVYEMYTKNAREKLRHSVGAFVYDHLSVAITFSFILFSFIFFRANTFSDSMYITGKIFSSPFHFSDLSEFISGYGKARFVFVFFLLILFILADIKIYSVVKGVKPLRPLLKYVLFSFIVVLIVLFGFFGNVEFIYFQF